MELVEDEDTFVVVLIGPFFLSLWLSSYPLTVMTL